MKKITLLTFLLFVGMLNAQVVTFADPVFKEKLVTFNPDYPAALDVNGNPFLVDANGDGEIQMTEALNVYILHLGNAGISSLGGIENFTNLKEFVGGYNYFTSFDATPFENLELLSLSENPVTSINVEGLQHLKYLWVGYTDLASLNLSDLPALKQLHCQDSYLTSLTVTNMPLLHEIMCSDNLLTEINLSALPDLYRVDCMNNLLSTIDLTNVPSLQWLRADNNPFTSLDLSSVPLLDRIEIGHSQLTELDVSMCPEISTVGAGYNEFLQSVNIKNGGVSQNAVFLYNPNLSYICIDEEEREDVQWWLDFHQVTGIELNTYCSYGPTGDFNTITGAFYFDADGNGCTTSEQVDGFVSVSINDGVESGTAFSDDGTYHFYTQAGNFTVTPQFENGWFTATPGTASLNLPVVNNGVTTQDFCIAPNGSHPDLEVLIIPAIPAQPGFDALYKVVYRNKGNQKLSGQVAFTYNDNVMDYLWSSPVETSSSIGTLIWDYNDLMPFEMGEIFVILNVNGPMETPAINIGDKLGFLVSITPNANDETPPDNSFDLKQEVEGSFDPNDITCLEGDTVHPDMIGEYLHYNINFENTGDAAATFIVVKDIINEAQFDMASLQMLYASHDVEVRVEDNKVEFYFDDIDLGPLEKGNVTFKIKTLNTLQVNDNVMQQAEIFFDYNWPIETNEANTVFAILSSGGFELDTTVKVYPNPAVDLVTIEAATALQSVQLYDVAGRLLQTTLANDTQASIDIASRAAGVYFVKITTDEGGKVEKIIKQ